MEKADILKYFKFDPKIRIEAGSDIRKYLEENDLLAILKDGQAEFVSAGGQTRVMLEPGTPLGILKGESPSEVGRITAVSECELIPIDEQKLASVFEFNHNFARDLVRVMCNTVNDLLKLLP